MAMDAVSGPQWAAIGAFGGVILKGIFDGVVKLIKARAEARRLAAKTDQERDLSEGQQSERKEVRTSDELWRLIEDMRTARVSDKAEFDRREAALNAKIDTMSKSLDDCHKEHREAAIELGAVKARLEIQERRPGRVRRPDDTGGSGTHKPLGGE